MTRPRKAGWPWVASALLCVALLPLVVWWSWRAWLGPFDLVICGGRVFDGEQWMGAGSCIGVRNGRIARIGWLWPAEARRYISARGQVVAPGFIETHAHVERNIVEGYPFSAPNFVYMGVTTLITGNCGTSKIDVARMLRGIDEYGGHINVATLIGHNSVREQVLGPRADRPASAAEIVRMAAMIERAVRGGALGFSTGLCYPPGAYAQEVEVIELARAAARAGGMYVTHLRDEGMDGTAALAEALRIGKLAGLPVHVSHFKVAAAGEWGTATARLALLEKAWDEHQRVTLDVYGYRASSTTLEILLPPHLRGYTGGWRNIVSDPRRKEDAVDGMLAQLWHDGFRDYGFARIAYYQRDRSLEGLTVPEVALRLHPHPKAAGREPHSVPLRDQAETVLELLARGGAQMIYFTMRDDDVETILRHPLCSIGSDSAVRGNDQTATHPRGMGNFPRIFRLYVRERHTITLEEALTKMTSLAADTFGLQHRGRLRRGWLADLVVFDPEKIADKSTFDSPLERPQGIRLVAVNGEIALDNGQLTDNFGGRAIYRQAPVAQTTLVRVRQLATKR